MMTNDNSRIFAVSDDDQDELVKALRAEFAEIRELVARKRDGNGGIYVHKFWAGVLGAVLTAMLLGLGGLVLGQESRLNVIEQSRFTDTDALRLRNEISRDMRDHEGAAAHREAEIRIRALESLHRD